MTVPADSATTAASETRARNEGHVFALIAILCLALNLRPVMAGLGPILDIIESSAGLTSAQAGLLTTLPVLLMGVGAFAGRSLTQLLGAKTGVAIGIAIISLACASRSAWNDAAGMLATAATAGLGVAIVQALLPGFIKGRFGVGAGRVMGLYTTGIMSGAALAAATAAGLERDFGLPSALAIWSIPALIATLVWSMLPFPTRGAGRGVSQTTEPLWRHGRAWTLMLFFGVGTGAFTLVLAWLPPYYTSLGQSRAYSGYLLAGVTLAEVAASLAVSAFIARFPDRRGPLVVVLTSITAGLICVAVAPLSLAWPAAVLLGLGLGALFPLSLIVTLDHVDDPARAGELAAFVQGGGYVIASLTPFVAGALRDRFADLTGAWEAMAVGVFLTIAIAMRFSPQSRLSKAPGAAP
jgi:MFS transporter, CP family, cyanate transporter